MTLAALLLAALMAVASTGGAEEAYQAGERAFREDRLAEASAEYRRALSIDPAHIPSLIRLGTLASWDDRLQESIDLFQRAVDIDPGNREARLGLARVCSWAAEHGRAVRIYEALLEENPGDREATLGLARTLSWSGDTAGAREFYRDLLDRDPGDTEARVGLARVHSWGGDLDRSLLLYEEVLAAEPANDAALEGRAQVLLWQGRLPEAREAVEEAMRSAPGNRSVTALDRTVRERYAPALQASAATVHDTDRNAADIQHLSWSWWQTPRLSLAGWFRRFDATQPMGASRLGARVEAAGARGSFRVLRDLVLSASAGAEVIRRDQGNDTTRGTASAAADYRLDDRWSFSGSLSRETFLATARSLDADVGIAAVTLGAAFVPVARLSTRLSVQYADLTGDNPGGFVAGQGDSHDNDRLLVAGYARWATPVRRPRLGVSWLGRTYSCDAPGVGYFCPENYQSHIAGIDLSDRIGKRFEWGLQGTLGVQRVENHGSTDSNSDTVTGYRARASCEFGNGLWFEIFFGRTDLALAAGSGFEWTESGIRIRWRFDGLAGIAGSSAPAGRGDGVTGEGGYR